MAASLNLKLLIEGFVSDAGVMIPDTVKVYLNHSWQPYAVADSATGEIGSDGRATLYFAGSSSTDSAYYINVKHRNSIETWSAESNTFSSSVMNYDFTISAARAFGNNLKQKGPFYCIYSGDVNKDGQVEATDLLLVDSDNINFVTGYTASDVNGDGQVEATDLLITDINNLGFVSKLTPQSGKKISATGNRRAKTFVPVQVSE